MIRARSSKRFGLGILLLVTLFWTDRAFCASFTEEERNNISVYEKSGGRGREHYEHRSSDGLFLQSPSRPRDRVPVPSSIRGGIS